MIGEEIFERGRGREVRERCDDSEDETFQIGSHKGTLVVYRAEPASAKKYKKKISTEGSDTGFNQT